MIFFILIGQGRFYLLFIILWHMANVSANKRRHIGCNVFSHWLMPFSLDQIEKRFRPLNGYLSCQFRHSIITQMHIYSTDAFFYHKATILSLWLISTLFYPHSAQNQNIHCILISFNFIAKNWDETWLALLVSYRLIAYQSKDTLLFRRSRHATTGTQFYILHTRFWWWFRRYRKSNLATMCLKRSKHLWPLLLTWISFNPSMDK